MRDNDKFQEGYQAFLDGHGWDANPYEEHSEENERWDYGWVVAQDEDEHYPQ